MRSFNILVDKNLIQGDLIVVNLPIRNDIAAYYWLTIGSELTNHIIAEKAISFKEDTASIILGTDVENAITKYEVVNATPVTIGAEADLKLLLYPGIDENGINIKQTLREVSQKIENVSLPTFIGVSEMLDIHPLKSLGHAESMISIEASASEIKNSIIKGERDQEGVLIGSSITDLFSIYHEKAESSVLCDVSIKSLSYLTSMRLMQTGVSIGVAPLDVAILRSLGKSSSRIAIGAEASLSTQFFVRNNIGVEIYSEAKTLSNKLISTDTEVNLDCTGDAVLRHLRSLEEVSGIGAVGTITDINDMSLEEIYYTDI